MTENDSNDGIEDRVLDAAKDLIAHYGYDKTTMNDIAQQAGVAKSTIYLRWKKKEDLFDALLMREGRILVQEWFKRVLADPIGGTFPAFYRHGLQMLFENEFLLGIYRRDKRTLGGLIKRVGVSNLYVQRQQMLTGFFASLQRANVVKKDIDGQTLAYLLNSFQYGLIEMGSFIPEEHTPDVSGSLIMVADMIEQFVTPEDGGDSEAGKQVLRQLKQQIDVILDNMEK